MKTLFLLLAVAVAVAAFAQDTVNVTVPVSTNAAAVLQSTTNTPSAIILAGDAALRRQALIERIQRQRMATNYTNTISRP